MARPREFDPDEILRQVIAVFWEHGFERTSFTKLEKATGLKKGSLFAAYGDKKTLFCSALERYQADKLECFGKKCGNSISPRKTIIEWLTETLKPADGSSQYGCFNINTTTGVSTQSAECACLLSTYAQKMENLLSDLISQGIALKEFSKSVDPKCGARYLMWVASGMMALSRLPQHNGCSATLRKRGIELILRALDA